MSNTARIGIALAILFALGATGGIWLFAQDRDATDPTVDAIERELETGRHVQLLARIAENDSVLDGFTTDGCSGGLSIGWEQFSARYPEFAVRHGEQPPWQDCCVVHDRQYHAGGSGSLSADQSFEQRKQADLDLKACVVDTGTRRSTDLQDMYGLTESQVMRFYEAISELMYRAVRVGGMPCSNQPWRWGYGWPQCR